MASWSFPLENVISLLQYVPTVCYVMGGGRLESNGINSAPAPFLFGSRIRIGGSYYHQDQTKHLGCGDTLERYQIPRPFQYS